MKNYIGQTLGLSILVTALLTGLSGISREFDFNGLTIRKMDILSDVRPDHPETEPDTLASDTTLLALVDTTAAETLPADSLQGPIPPVDEQLFGRIIEDYTFDQKGLTRFFAAIDSIRTSNRTVRIAFFGDSFIEGDILVGDLRDTLQSLWGGRGVGYVPITSEVARFKRTINHTYNNWSTYSIVKNPDKSRPYGINGFVYYPRENAVARYESARYFRNTRYWSRTRLFYGSASNDTLLYRLNGGTYNTQPLNADEGRIAFADLKMPGTTQAELRVQSADSACLYGVSFEDGPGIYIDNFSIRGNSGGRLKLIRPAIAKQFDAIQHYDLVIVQLGLNAVTPKLNNIKWYQAELDQTFAHLRACFPGKPILFVSVADKAGKIDGELVTLPSVPVITSMQRDLARKYGFLFYDMFHGMGGPGSMIAFSKAKPALANTDYTHLTHEGGKVLGLKFASLMLETQASYQGHSFH